MLESIEGGEKKEIMDALLEIKEKMNSEAPEERKIAIDLYESLSSQILDGARDTADDRIKSLFAEVEERISQLQQEASAYEEDILARTNQEDVMQGKAEA